MKKIYKSIFLFAIVFAIAGFSISCKKNKDNGTPRIDYIRITSLTSADSLVVAANQGNLLAIIGENLQDAQQIWFNDQKAVLTPTYITSTSILVSVPSLIPTTINDKMKIIFSSGDSLLYDFHVTISKPTIGSMDCEYVLEGGVATIHGDFFYKPLTVTFTGGVTGSIVSVKDQLLQVTVPAGAEPGPITITTNFGSTKSGLWFRDNRNIFISSDPYSGWWNESFVVNNPGTSDVPAINGNYIRVKQNVGSWSWMEVAGGPPSAMGNISKSIPDNAILHPELYDFKFEVNTIKPYNNNVIKINCGLSGAFNNDAYLWKPPYDTKGLWQTVVIPFKDLTDSYVAAGVNLSVSSDGYYARLLFHGPGALDCDMSFDNFRIVPKK